MDATIIVGDKRISVPSDVLDVFMLAINRWVDTGDIVVDDVDSETLAAAKEISGEIRLLLLAAAAKQER